jgi:hypothetical protein
VYIDLCLGASEGRAPNRRRSCTFALACCLKGTGTDGMPVILARSPAYIPSPLRLLPMLVIYQGDTHSRLTDKPGRFPMDVLVWAHRRHWHHDVTVTVTDSRWRGNLKANLKWAEHTKARGPGTRTPRVFGQSDTKPRSGFRLRGGGPRRRCPEGVPVFCRV